MRSERALVNQIRGLMASSNPVPAGVYKDEAPYQTEIADLLTELRFAPPEPADQQVDDLASSTTRTPPSRKRRKTAWPVLAPVLSALAVVSVVTSLAVAGGQEPHRPKSGPRTPSAAPLPRYFAAIRSRGAKPPALAIHRTSTGKMVAELTFQPGFSPLTALAAASSGRVFYVVDEKLDEQDQVRAFVHKAQLSATGHWTIADLPEVDVRLPQSSDILVTGIGVSPDGSRLAFTLQQASVTGKTRTEIEVLPANGKGLARVWTAPAVPAIAADPVWTDGHDLAFLWQDHLTGSAKFAGRSQERVLDTSLPGSRLLAAKVLITSQAGLIETAFASPDGGPIFATIAKDVPAKGDRGVATVRLVWFTPHQSGFKTLAVHTTHYRLEAERERGNAFYQVLGLDSSGQHAIVNSPGLGMMTTTKLKSLPGVVGPVTGAAW